jgi:Ala-tRNA(Pro) deacylase
VSKEADVIVTQQVGVTAGDIVEISGRRIGDPGRLGEVVEVLGTADHRHYLVRWDDEHESILYPGEGTTIRTGRRHRIPRRPKVDLAAVERLKDDRIAFEVLPHRRTMTATSEARALGVLSQAVAKTVIARDDEGACVRAVVPASMRLDLVALANVLGAKRATLVSESELVSAYPQFELGAVPPFGGPAGDRVVVDRRLAEHEYVVLEAGVHDTSLRLRTADMLTAAGAELADIAVG